MAKGDRFQGFKPQEASVWRIRLLFGLKHYEK